MCEDQRATQAAAKKVSCVSNQDAREPGQDASEPDWMPRNQGRVQLTGGSFKINIT